MTPPSSIIYLFQIKVSRVQLGLFFGWVLAPIWAELFTFSARSIMRIDVFFVTAIDWSVKLHFWSALQHVCITSPFIQSKTHFHVPVGILSSKLFPWLPYITNHTLFLPLPPTPASSLYFSPPDFLLFFFPSAVDGNTWAQVIALYPTLVECITCSSSEVSSALKEALGPFKDFMQPPVSKVQNGESWPSSLSAPCFYNEEILNVSTHPVCFMSTRTWTLREPHLRWHEDSRPSKPQWRPWPSYTPLYASHVSW